MTYIVWEAYKYDEVKKRDWHYVWTKGRIRILATVNNTSYGCTHFEFHDLGIPAISPTGYRSHFYGHGYIPKSKWLEIINTLIPEIIKENREEVIERLNKQTQEVLFNER